MIENDRGIRLLVLVHRMIDPFSERVAEHGYPSYGLQSAGYDARLDPDILVISDVFVAGKILDPMNLDRSFFVPRRADPYYDIPPHTFVEGMTVEKFRIPRTHSARGLGKTCYSSIGISLLLSAINPGWEGRLRLHISNATHVPIRIYGGQGIVHLQFEPLTDEPEADYSQLANTRFQDQQSL